MKKSILFFHPSSELYGADKILIYVMKNFPDYKKVLVLRSEGPLINLIKKELPNIEIRIIPSLPIISKKNFKLSGILEFLYSLITFPSKIKDFRKENPDIVYLNTLAVIPILFYFSSRVKKIIHIHEILKNDTITHRYINKLALFKADILICVSKAVKLNMEASCPAKKDKLKLIYNGISFNKDSENKEIFFSVDETKINFALIGRIKPSHKGQNLLLAAINELEPKHLEMSHFYFVGSPVSGQEYMKDEVIKLITALGLERHVEIIPFVEKIEYIYQKMDVIIVPSVFDDPFPTTVLEGMFFNKPIIGTNVGGIPEMIDDNVTGFIVERDNAFDLSNKIAYYIKFPHKIEEMGKNGGKCFLKHFSEASFMERYQAMLNNEI